MPPRYVYWTILAGGLPTAFRAAELEDLLPTFNRIKDRHPDAELKYFARGRLWSSAEEARKDAADRRARDQRPDSRGRDWRPGGEHRDRRQRFIDAKKDRNLKARKRRFERSRAPGADQSSEGPRPPRARPKPDSTPDSRRRMGQGAKPPRNSSWGRQPDDRRPKKPAGRDRRRR
jgi:hypothetical protein